MRYFKILNFDNGSITMVSTPENNISILNGIRREMMSGIDVYAMHEENATILLNNSPFYSDFLLKNRLPLMPIKYNNVKDKQLELHLCKQDNLSEPLKNKSQNIMQVKLQDFQIFENSDENKKINPEEVFLYPNMTILWLRPEQEIHLKYNGFKKDNGYNHAMFQNFKITQYDHSGLDKYNNPETTLLSMESIGKIDAITGFMIVLNKLATKLDSIKNNVVDVGSDTKITKIDDYYFTFSLQNETFTISEILKHYIIKELHKLSNYSSDITSLFNVSANQVHPLKNEIVFQIQLYEPYILKGEQEIKNIITVSCNSAIKEINEMMEEAVSSQN